jgi:hypothetical protein
MNVECNTACVPKTAFSSEVMHQSKFYEGTPLFEYSWKKRVVDYTDANLRTFCTFTIIMKAGIECHVCNGDEFSKTALGRSPPASEMPNKGRYMILTLATIDWHKATLWNEMKKVLHIYPQSFGKFQFFTWAKESGFFMAASAACKQIPCNVVTLRLQAQVGSPLDPSFSFHVWYVYLVARQQNPCKVFQSAIASLVRANIWHTSVSGKFFLVQ